VALAWAGFGMVTLFRSGLRAFRVAGGEYFLGGSRYPNFHTCAGYSWVFGEKSSEQAAL
jgi:hypothetical protein